MAIIGSDKSEEDFGDFTLENTLAQVPDTELRRYEKLLQLKNTRVEFATKYHVNQRGEKMSWDHPHILALYEETSPVISVQGSTQCLKSEWVICNNLAAMYCGLNVFFVLPKHSMRSTYVRNRIDRLIDASPGYKAISGVSNGSHLKQFGRGVTRYVSSNRQADFTEFPGDCCCRDTRINLGDSSTKRICDLKIGDTILAYDGRSIVPDKVVGVYRRGIKEILSVKTSDGRDLRCTLGEKFYTNSGWKYLYELVKDECYEFCEDGSVRYIRSKSNGDDLRLSNGRFVLGGGVPRASGWEYSETSGGSFAFDYVHPRGEADKLLSPEAPTAGRVRRQIQRKGLRVKLGFRAMRKVLHKENSGVESFRRRGLCFNRQKVEVGTAGSQNHYSRIPGDADFQVSGLLVHGRRESIRSLCKHFYRLLRGIRSRFAGFFSESVRCEKSKEQSSIDRKAGLGDFHRAGRDFEIFGRYGEVQASGSGLQMGQFGPDAPGVWRMPFRTPLCGVGRLVPSLWGSDAGVYRGGAGAVQAACIVGDSGKARTQDGETTTTASEIGASQKYSRAAGVFQEAVHSQQSGEDGDLLRGCGEFSGGEEEKNSGESSGGSISEGYHHRGGDSSTEGRESSDNASPEGETKLLNDKGEWVSITGITYFDTDEVWDIQTEVYHNFYAEGVLVHNCVQVEEVDHCDQNNLVFAPDRLAASPYKFFYKIGNPTIEKFGINAAYLAGDRKRWCVKCTSCGKARPLDWFRHVVRTIVNSKRKIIGYELRHKDWDIKSGKPLHAICPCGGILDRKIGTWWATKPENYYVGGSSYLINALMSTHKPIEELYHEFVPAMSDMGLMAHFHKSILGLPYTPSDNKVSNSLLSSAIIEGFKLLEDGEQSYLPEDRHDGPCFLGMDVGASLDVCVLYLNNKGTKILVFCGKLKSLDEVRDVIERYNVRVAVVDRMPETSLVRELQQTADIPVWLCQYSESASGVSGGVRANQAEMELLTDRTEHLDAVFKSVHARMLRIPENYMNLMDGLWYKEMTASVRTLVEASKGKQVYRWTDNHPDHQFHAMAYANLAAAMGGERLTVYVG